MYDTTVPVIYEINADALYYMITQGLQLLWEKGSLFENNPKHFDDTMTYTFSETEKSLLNEHAFQKIGRVLARPSHYCILRIGGSHSSVDTSFLYGSETDPDALVLIAKDHEKNQFLIKYHWHKSQYTDWITSVFASQSPDLEPNYLPPLLKLKDFYALIHCIDCYRRVSYSHMLEYSYSAITSVPLKTYLSSFSASLASGDVRWLLPSVEALLPSLSAYDIDVVGTDLKVLIDTNFIDGILTSDEDALVYSGIGIMNGMEFMRNWTISLGFEFFHVADSTSPSLRLYLAPTSKSNHFILFSDDGNDSLSVNHQSYNKDLFVYKFNELLSNQFSSASADPQAADADYTDDSKGNTVDRIEDNPARHIEDNPVEHSENNLNDWRETVTPKFCNQCGSGQEKGAKFCPTCGNKLI